MKYFVASFFPRMGDLPDDPHTDDFFYMLYCEAQAAMVDIHFVSLDKDSLIARINQFYEEREANSAPLVLWASGLEEDENGNVYLMIQPL